MSYEHDDPSLRTGADGLTVWTLHDMCQGKQFNELNHLHRLPWDGEARAGVADRAGTAVLVTNEALTGAYMAARHDRPRVASSASDGLQGCVLGVYRIG